MKQINDLEPENQHGQPPYVEGDFEIKGTHQSEDYPLVYYA
jgi:hypothetical protein